METAGRKIPGHGYVVEKYVERKIRFIFDQEWTASTLEDKKNENFYSFCIYEILKFRRRTREENPTLNPLKVKIARLHVKQFQSIFVDRHVSTQFQGEIPSLSHLVQLRKQRVSRMITSVSEKDGIAQTTTRAFCKTMLSSCEANVILFRWMMRVYLEWRKQGLGTYRWDGGTS